MSTPLMRENPEQWTPQVHSLTAKDENEALQSSIDLSPRGAHPFELKRAASNPFIDPEGHDSDARGASNQKKETSNYDVVYQTGFDGILQKKPSCFGHSTSPEFTSTKPDTAPLGQDNTENPSATQLQDRTAFSGQSCICDERPTWLEMFFGRGYASKKKNPGEAKCFLYGDSKISIEARQKLHDSDARNRTNKKLRGLLPRLHSHDDSFNEDSVVSQRTRWTLIGNSLFFLFFAILVVLFSIWYVDRTVTVTTRKGRYVGNKLHVGAGVVYEFLAVPYAGDVVKERRFRRSRIATDTKVMAHTATAKKPSCVQGEDKAISEVVVETDEDCLHLNIWTPFLPKLCYDNCRLRHVVVAFVGRDFEFGGNGHEMYEGQYLAGYGDIVVVVPNFRLGVFGFLKANYSKTSGNMGLYDQRVALDWVRENIEFFGGNTTEIVPFGHDTGAVSLGYHLLSPERHWVQDAKKFIFHTSSPLRRFADNSRAAISNAQILTRTAECLDVVKHGSWLRCLRTLHAEALVRAVFKVQRGWPLFVPSFNTTLLPEAPWTMKSWDRPWLRNKQFLVGSVKDEGTVEMNMVLTRLQGAESAQINANFVAEMHALLTAYNLSEISEIEKIYNGTEYSREFWQTVLGDILYICPINYLAESLSSKGNAVYSFVFAQRPSWKGAGLATRYDDIHFLFGTPLRSSSASSEVDKELSMTVIDDWSRFVKNMTLPVLSTGRPWAPFSADAPNTVFVHSKGYHTSNTGFRKRQCDLLKRHLVSAAIN